MLSQEPVAIIDIGSNSVRLVVYAGARRVPFPIFNEKVMAGLGRKVAETGELSQSAQERALSALRRFAILVREMGVRTTHVVATAAVREASNGEAFLAQIRAIGFAPVVLTGKQEAVAAGMGVISGTPEAAGTVADLGGGSLELVEVADGRVHGSTSLPFGVLRIGPALKDRAVLTRKVSKAISAAGVGQDGRRAPLYLVGGSWRALARIDMTATSYPLPIVHHYEMLGARATELEPIVAVIDERGAREINGLQPSRVGSLPAATFLLKLLVRELRPSKLIVSSFGIREGLLFQALDAETRARDPLIDAAREAGRGLGRFAEHGSLLDRWIAPLFPNDGARAARLRRAACLLSDVAWQAHPDFRAERGVDMALHGNWVGVDGPGRVVMAQALFSNFGGEGDFGDSAAATLCSPEELRRARQWGLAMRVGQRMSGGVASALEGSRLWIENGVLRLSPAPDRDALIGETVERRLKALATALALRPELCPA